jgi:hypothetical protein
MLYPPDWRGHETYGSHQTRCAGRDDLGGVGRGRRAADDARLRVSVVCPQARRRRVRLRPAHVTGCVPALVRR